MSRRSSVSSIASSATAQNRKEQQKSSLKAEGKGMNKANSTNPFLAQDANRSRQLRKTGSRSSKKNDEDTSIISKLQKFNNLSTKEEKPSSLLAASADPVLLLALLIVL